MNLSIIKHTLFLTGSCLLIGALYAQEDKFAEIGGRKYDTRAHLLIEPQPAVLPDVHYQLSIICKLHLKCKNLSALKKNCMLKWKN